MQNVINKLALSYTEGHAEVTDAAYDDVLDIMNMYRETPSDLVGDMTTGSTTNKILLPKKMKSMNKFKGPSDFCKWKNMFNPNSMFHISGKMDGVSMLINENRAYTRGNGIMGQDITWVKDLLGIPSTESKNIFVRGELILNKQGWEIIKDQTTITNPLSFISGFVNSKTPNVKHIAHIDFVTFQYLDSSNTEQPLSEQYKILKELNFKTADSALYTAVEYEDLQDILDTYRDNVDYVLDGIIIAEDAEHVRVDDKNPTFAYAYKDYQEYITTVRYVKWNESIYGNIKPTVYIEPFTQDDKEYIRATGFNAAYIFENDIGPGTTVSVAINIVPVIKDVIEGVEGVEADMPDITDMIWKGRELVSTNANSIVRRAKMIEKFVVELGVEKFKEKSITKVINAGYPTIFDILDMSSEDFKSVLGKNGIAIHKALKYQYNRCNDEDLFLASSIFQGIGKSLVNSLFDTISIVQLLTNDIPMAIPNFGDGRLKVLKDGVPLFIEWMAKLPERTDIQARKATVKCSKDQIKVILTGEPPTSFASKEKYMETYPELFLTTKWKEVDLVLTNDMLSETSKAKQAAAKSIPMMTYTDYMLDGFSISQ